jgi:hypothetical protein
MSEVQFGFVPVRAFINKDRGNKPCVVGKASDDLPDHQRERVSEKGLLRWVDQAKKGLDLLETHRSTFGFGRTYDARVKKTDAGVNEYEVEFELDPKYPQAMDLFQSIQAGTCNKQMSIGGDINLANPECVRFEVGKDGEVVRVLEDVQLDHISTTRANKAANSRTGFSAAILKSLDGDAAGPGKSMTTAPTTKAQTSSGKEHHHVVTIVLKTSTKDDITFVEPVIRFLEAEGHTHEIDHDNVLGTTEVDGHRHTFNAQALAEVGVRAEKSALDLGVMGETVALKGALGTAEHQHRFILEINKDGDVFGGLCAEVDGHTHPISKEDLALGTTGEVNGHRHSFDVPDRAQVAKALAQTSAAPVEKRIRHTYGRTSADSGDGHAHYAVLDESGNGQTDMAGSPPHCHVIRGGKVQECQPMPGYTSRHDGDMSPEDDDLYAKMRLGAMGATQNASTTAPTAPADQHAVDSLTARLGLDYLTQLGRALAEKSARPPATQTEEFMDPTTATNTTTAAPATTTVAVAAPAGATTEALKALTEAEVDQLLAVLERLPGATLPESRAAKLKATIATASKALNPAPDAVETVLRGMESLKSLVEGKLGGFEAAVEKSLEARLPGLKTSVEKALADATTAAAKATEVATTVEKQGQRIAAIEKLEGGTGGKPDDVTRNGPPANSDDVFKGLLAPARRHALARMAEPAAKA